MTRYIELDALVAEIDRRIKNLYPKGGQGMVLTKILKDHYEDLLSFINTIEVKEVPEWKPAAIAYKKDRLPRYDSALKRIVDRDEDGCYFLTMDDLYKLPKAKKGVDFEKEISNYLGDDWRKDADGEIENEMIAFAKHFFELGLKAQKGE